jgi:hypothetical protein
VLPALRLRKEAGRSRSTPAACRACSALS